MAKVVGKRIYTSMFDPFVKDIEEWCDQGLTVKQIWAKLPAGYAYQSLYTYIRKNRIREGAWKRAVDARNKCEKCEYCKEVRNAKGKFDKACMLCTKSWRMISASVIYRPTWCELETKYREDYTR